MVTNTGSDSSDRTIGLGSGSNDEGAIFALTFAALDIILAKLVDSIFHWSPASVHSLMREGNYLTSVRGGIHERGELRE